MNNFFINNLLVNKNTRKSGLIGLSLLVSVFLGVTCFASGDHNSKADEHEEITKGSHNGCLLKDGDFNVELTIFEKGIAPEYRAWASDEGKTISPNDLQLSVELTRLGIPPERYSFTVQEDFLRSKSEVKEPHSFDVSVTAIYKGKKHQWTFQSYEGRVQMSAALAKSAGINTAIAGGERLEQTLKVYGQALADPVRLSHIQARYPGVIRSVKATIGSQVRAGDVLATVESNESLRQYNITAPISGTIIERHANPDEFTGDKTLFILVDYSQLEVDLQIFPKDAQKIKTGQPVKLHAGDLSAATKIEYITPHGEGASTLVAHAPLSNPQSQWTPNQSLQAEITLAETPVALAVDNRALQNFREWQVVFIQVGDTYEIRPLELGRSDGKFTEVISGLNKGDSYVVENSYLLKADLEKSGASHDH